MEDKDKLQLLQQVGNDVVESYGDFVTDVMTTPILLKDAVKALEIVLVAMGARDEDVIVEAMEVEDLSAPVFTSPTGPEGQG